MEYHQDSNCIIFYDFHWVVSSGVRAYFIFYYYSLIVVSTQSYLVDSFSDDFMLITSDYIQLSHLHSFVVFVGNILLYHMLLYPFTLLLLFSLKHHTYNTRSSKSQLFSTKYSRLNLQKKAFSRVGVKIWNKIPKEFKTLSKHSFNKQIKTSLFQILDNEDSYLDVEKISSKLKDCIIKTN